MGKPGVEAGQKEQLFENRLRTALQLQAIKNFTINLISYQIKVFFSPLLLGRGAEGRLPYHIISFQNKKMQEFPSYPTVTTSCSHR